MPAARPSPVETIEVGEVAITFLPDGEAHFEPTGMFPASSSEQWEGHERWLDDDGRYVAAVGAFLLRTAGRAIVVDLGLGKVDLEIPGFARATSGRLLESLATTGVAPADVDTVVMTHLHGDHTGWTADGEGTLTFASAEHLVGSESEMTFWRENPDAAFAPSAEAVLDPISTRVEIVGDGHAVVPGVTLVATPGHTPGHQSLVVSSGGERAVIMGDLLHCPVQLVEPEWSVLFDVDPVLARTTREKMLDELESDDDVRIACGHFPEAAFGRVLRGRGTRYWQPGT